MIKLLTNCKPMVQKEKYIDMTPLPEPVANLINENDIRYVDFRFTDMRGRWHHITMPIRELEEEAFARGFNFDGSSINGWCDINHSDMIYRPDPESAFVDPFMDAPTLVLTCDIIDPITDKFYNRDPRGIAKRAENYLKESGMADTAFMGPELEFFLFDDVTYATAPQETFFSIDSDNGSWAAGMPREEGNNGHVTGVKSGYFALSPRDKNHDLRTYICDTLDSVGIESQLHHQEVASGSQSEIGMTHDTLLRKADQVQRFKYVVHNVADLFGRTATFMPKPLSGDNGTGMHVHQSLWDKGKNLFAGDAYDGLSQEALYYIGGIIKHAQALNAFTNPSTNSYKRLIPGFEAPVMLAYASRNRSASIRIPASANSPKAKRIEVRFPDGSSNPYLAFSAMMMAGLDGIKNKIDPGKAASENLYDLPKSKKDKLPQVCGSLRQALDALQKDHAFLCQGDVFDKDFIEAYIDLKMEEVHAVEHTPHPKEFELYYSS